jgi:hypothetical protein
LESATESGADVAPAFPPQAREFVRNDKLAWVGNATARVTTMVFTVRMLPKMAASLAARLQNDCRAPTAAVDT